MYCPQCGHQTDGGNFCETCGSPLPRQSGQPQAAQAGAAAKQAAKPEGLPFSQDRRHRFSVWLRLYIHRECTVQGFVLDLHSLQTRHPL